MNKARHRNDWYHLLSDDANFEAEFEALIVQNAALLRPDAVVIPFRETILADDLPPRRADLALIDAQYRFWWVIEVELVGHNLNHHVLPQVRTFVEGRYGSAHIAAMMKADPSLDGDRLGDMVRAKQPDVVVISNRHDSQWEIALRNEDVHFCVMNIFRSENNRDIFLIGDGLPHPASECLTDIVAAKNLPGFYRIAAPGSLDLSKKKSLMLDYRGKPLSFTVYQTATDWFLIPNDSRIRSRAYSIFLDSGRFELRERDG